MDDVRAQEPGEGAEEAPSLVLTVAFLDHGGVSITAEDVAFEEFEKLATNVKDEAGDAYEVRQVIWAGPYELILSLAELAGAGAVSVSLSLLLERLSSKKPEYRIKVRLDDGTEFEIGPNVPKPLRKKLDQLALDHADRFDVEGLSKIVEEKRSR